MANKNQNKKIEKLQTRIEELEFELKHTLQKKSGPTISVSSYTTKIMELKKQLTEMRK